MKIPVSQDPLTQMQVATVIEQQKIATAIAALTALSADQINDLIPTLNQIIRDKRRNAVRAAAVVIAKKTGGEFKFNDILSWVSSNRNDPGRKYIRYVKMNRAGTCVVGMECNPDGSTKTPAPGKSGQWTVGLTNIDVVNGKKI